MAVAGVSCVAVALVGDDADGWRRSGYPALPLTRGFLLLWGVLIVAYLLINGPWLLGWARRTARALRDSAADDDVADMADMAAYGGLSIVWRPRLVFLVLTAGPAFLLRLSASLGPLRPSWWWLAVAVVIWWLRRKLGKWIVLLLAALLLVQALPLAPGHRSPWFAFGAAVVSLAAAGALLVVTLGARAMAGRTRYPPATSRPVVALGNGARKGAAGAAWLLVTAPVVVLDSQFFVGSTGAYQHPTGRVLGLMSIAVAHHPVSSALLLVVAPIGVLILLDRWSARIVTVDANELDLAWDVPTSLYLRSWTADRVRLRTEGVRLGILENLSPPRRSSLAELIGEAAQWAAPVVATGEPGARRIRGVSPMWSADDEWRSNVWANASRALCVLLTGGEVMEGSGYSWELDLLGAGAAGGRLVIVLPPGLSPAEAKAAGGFLHHASALPAFAGLASVDLDPSTIVLARSHAQAWKSFGSSDRTDVGYVLCIREAFDHFRGDWEDELLGRVEGMSSDRLVREAARAFGNNPFVQTLAHLAGWSLRTGWAERMLRRLDSVLEIGGPGEDPPAPADPPATPEGRAVDRYDPAARRAVVHAQDAARQRGDAFIGSEHLLLGILREESGPAVLALARHDVFSRDVTQATDALFPGGGAEVDGLLPFTPEAKEVLELAGTEAVRRGLVDRVGVEHLLVALASDASRPSALVLSHLGVDLDQITVG